MERGSGRISVEKCTGDLNEAIPVLQIFLNLNAMNAMEPQIKQSADLPELCVKSIIQI